jgi:hypothetical protein
VTTYEAVMADIRKARPRRKPAGQFMSEHVLQIAVAEYLDRALPPDAFWTSIDSAGRGARDGARMKRRGVRKGIPDILILWQLEFQFRARGAGHQWYLCRSLENVAADLIKHGIPLRGWPT